MNYSELHQQLSLKVLGNVAPAEAAEPTAFQAMTREYRRRPEVYRTDPVRLLSTSGGRITAMGDVNTTVVVVGTVLALVDIALRHLALRMPDNANGRSRWPWRRRRAMRDGEAVFAEVRPEIQQEIEQIVSDKCRQWAVPIDISEKLPVIVIKVLIEATTPQAQSEPDVVRLPRSQEPSIWQADVGLLTVLSEETRAVIEILARGSDYRTHESANGAVFHTASLMVGDKMIRLAATQTVDRGQRSATVAYGRLRQFCSAPVVVLVGVAGGIHPDLQLNDVVIVDEVVYYELRKDTPAAVLRRDKVMQVSVAIRNAMNAFFTANGEPVLLAGENDRTFQVIRGTIGSGEAVVANRNSEIREYLRRSNERTLAVEMEAAGVAQACDEEKPGDGQLLGWLSVRGISDHADVAKTDDHKVTASRHAAAVVERLLPFLYTQR